MRPVRATAISRSAAETSGSSSSRRNARSSATKKGRAKIEWVKDAEKRNETLDCRVYAFAALRLDSPDWQREGYALKKRAEAEAAPAAVPAADESAAEPAAARKLPAVRPLFPAAGKAQPPPAAPQKQTSVLARLTALRRRR